MVKDFIINEAIKKAIYELENAYKYNICLKKYCDYFSNLTEKEKVEIIDEIIDSQFEWGANNIEMKRDFMLPIIGTFKIKSNKKDIYAFKDILANESGYESYRLAPLTFKHKIENAINNPNITEEEDIKIRQRIIEMFRQKKANKRNTNDDEQDN